MLRKLKIVMNLSLKKGGATLSMSFLCIHQDHINVLIQEFSVLMFLIITNYL